jgi:hypothetical protein
VRANEDRPKTKKTNSGLISNKNESLHTIGAIDVHVHVAKTMANPKQGPRPKTGSEPPKRYRNAKSH